MKNRIIYLLSIVFCLVQGLNGQVFFADDEYIGADPTHDDYDGEDRIGDADVFEVSGWRTDEDVNADTLTVSIQSTYFDNFQSGSNLLGTTLGDLFISTNGLSWNNPADTVNDSFAISGSTKWDMAVDLPDSFSQAGSAGLFAITDSNIRLAQDVLEPTNNIYRADQEVLLKDLGDSVATAYWSFNFDDPQNGILSVTFNNVSSLFGTGNDIGFHWTMTCANDVVEFEHIILTPVPEPATLGLLGGFGLMGYLFIRRRFKARK